MTVSPRYDQYKDAWDTSVLVEVKISTMIPLFLCGSVRILLLKIIVLFFPFVDSSWGQNRNCSFLPLLQKRS